MKILLTLCLCLLSLSVYSQNSRRVIRERKRVIKECSPSRNPLILLDHEKKLTQKEYLDIPDSLVVITYTVADTCIEKDRNGVINVDTRAYMDAVDAGYRRNAMRDYRIGEIRCFFGEQSPLIMYGDKTITKEEYYELEENKVAFVNFYLSDYVRRNYALPNTNGVVYVHPRSVESTVMYSTGMPMPANSRNYADVWPRVINKKMEGTSATGYYIWTKLKAYTDSVCKGVKGTLVMSCVVDTAGVIKPLLVERFDNANELALANKDKLTAIAEDIIRNMPRWQRGMEILYDSRKRKQFCVDIEYSVSLNFRFDTTEK